jgi:hypothetical protein
MPLTILAYATFQFGICHFPIWDMSIICLSNVRILSPT